MERGGFRGRGGMPRGGAPGVRGRGGFGGGRGRGGPGGVGRGAGRGVGMGRGGGPPRGRGGVFTPPTHQYQGYEQATPDSYGAPQPASSVGYGGQGYSNGSYGSGYGGGQAQGYGGGQGYGGYGQNQGYDSAVATDYTASGYPAVQDTRYSTQQAQQPDPYGEYAKPTRHYEAESYTAGYNQGGASGGYQAGYDDRSGYQAQAYDASGYGGAQAVQTPQQYGATAGYGQSRDYNQHRSRY